MEIIRTGCCKSQFEGVVTGKKTGNALIYATVENNCQFACAVSVVSPGLKKVVNYAKMIGRHWSYSRKKRMSKGYYDCSALVWKSYHKINKNFGNSTYAPVAANVAQWCAKNKKMIKGGLTSELIEKMKLRPGDLIFLTGENNGRYKGIYHVEMFVGYRYNNDSEYGYGISTM